MCKTSELGVGNLLTTDKLVNVRIANVAGGFHLATQGKVVGYDRDILARARLCIGCHSRTPSRKIPRQEKALVSHSSLHGVSVALAFCNFPVPPFLW